MCPFCARPKWLSECRQNSAYVVSTAELRKELKVKRSNEMGHKRINKRRSFADSLHRGKKENCCTVLRCFSFFVRPFFVLLSLHRSFWQIYGFHCFTKSSWWIYLRSHTIAHSAHKWGMHGNTDVRMRRQWQNVLEMAQQWCVFGRLLCNSAMR